MDQPLGPSTSNQSEYMKHLYQGSELLLSNKLLEARTALEKAASIDPEDPKGLSLLGLIYYRLAEYNRAKDVYQKLVDRFPKEASLRVNLGLVHMMVGQTDLAIDEMKQAIEADPNHQRAHVYLGHLYAEQGDHEAARHEFLLAGQNHLARRMEQVSDRSMTAEDFVRTPVDEHTLTPLPPSSAEQESFEPMPLQRHKTPALPLQAVPPAGSGGIAEQEEMSGDEVEPLPDDLSFAVEHTPAPADDTSTPVAEPVSAEEASAQQNQAGHVDEAQADEPGLAVEPEPDSEEAVSETDEARPSEGEEAKTAPDDGLPLMAAENGSEKKAALPGASRDTQVDLPFEPMLFKPTAHDPKPSSDVDSAAVKPPSSKESEQFEPSPFPTPDSVSDRKPPDLAEPSFRPAEPIFAFATSNLVDPANPPRSMERTRQGLLLTPVEDETFIRETGLIFCSNDMDLNPAHKRFRGQTSDEIMEDMGLGQLLRVHGEGLMVSSPGEGRFTVIELFDDFIYLRQHYLFAFEPSLYWENGRIRGQQIEIPMVLLRGEGRLAIWTSGDILKVRVIPSSKIRLPADLMVGWVGRLVASFQDSAEQSPDSSPMIYCHGEGVVLMNA